MAKKKPKHIGPQNPWDRQEGETDCAWRAFVAYRDQGPAKRTLAETARILGITPQSVAQFSRRMDWVKRCEAWDRWRDQETQLAEIEALKKMRRRQISISLSMQRLGGKTVRVYERIMKESGTAVLDPDQARLMVESGVKIERLNRGQATEVSHAVVESREVGELSDEELERIAAKDDSVEQ